MAQISNWPALALVIACSAQAFNPAARDVIKLERHLTEAEVAAIMDASRRAIDGRAFRLSFRPDGPGPAFLMGPNGRPRYLRMTSGTSGRADTITFIEYTNVPARGCDGHPRAGELVLEYESKDGAGWKVIARTRSVEEINDSAFDMLSGRIAATADGLRRLDDRTVRAVTAPYKLPEGATGGPPPGTMMALWIDVDSLLPVRWSLNASDSLPEFAVNFVYFDAADFERPPPVHVPDCVP